MNKRQKAFSDFSAEDKASIFKLHLALQLVKYPNLSKEQKDIILESITTITSDIYDRTKQRSEFETQSLESRSGSLFTSQEAVEIFASLGGNSQDVKMIRKYQNIVGLPSFPERKITFRKLLSTDMSNLWKVQLAFYLVKDKTLTNPQKEFIVRMIDFVRPSLFEVLKNADKKSEPDENIQILESEALTLFSEQKALTIFNKLGFTGNYEPSWDDFDPVLEGGDCTCRSGGGDCSGSLACAGSSCESTWFGCGFLYLQSCTGVCRL